MCDYSLQHVASRPAMVGDELLTSRFFGTATLGFVCARQPAACLHGVAVCLRPGTELVFDGEAEYRRSVRPWLPLFSFAKSAGKVAVFRQVEMDNPHRHHDALEFPDGTVVPLTHLRVGQRARVLQLPAEPEPAKSRAEAENRPVPAELVD